MDTLNKNYLEPAITTVLEDYLKFLGKDLDNEIQLIIDEKQKHYLLVETGWQKIAEFMATLSILT